MNYLKSIVFILISILAFSSCKSKEEKAAELIKTELSKTLYDFDSYEPIETKVTEAYETAYNDSTCMAMACVMAYGMDQINEYLKEIKDAQDHMEIWGAPSYYSSSYSDKQYYKYRDEAQEKLEKAQTAMLVVKAMGIALQDSIASLDPQKVIGWKVNHRFRCKTRGGQASIGDYNYIISPNFDVILWREDCDDEKIESAHKLIKSAINKELKDIDSNN